MQVGGGRKERWVPIAAMLAVNLAMAVMNLLVKKSLEKGMNCLILVTMRQVVATAFMAPIAYFKERKNRPKLTWWISTQFFFSALLGACLTQYLFFLGLGYTNATFACAFLNMAPVLTFLLTLVLRQERLSLKNSTGKVKLMATLICIGGVLILMFYKGPPIDGGRNLAAQKSHATTSSSSHRVTIGSMVLFGGCFCWSAWFIVQAQIGKQYQAIYSNTTIMFFVASSQAAVLALATTRSKGVAILVLSLHGKLQIVTILFSGVVGSGVCFLVMSWCIEKRGPVFTVAFTPLLQVFVAIIEFFLTRQLPFLGSIVGSVLVVMGLYLLLWAKSRENGSCEVIPVSTASTTTTTTTREVSAFQ